MDIGLKINIIVMYEYDALKEHLVESDEIEKETMRYLRVIWNRRRRHEQWKDCELKCYIM